MSISSASVLKRPPLQWVLGGLLGVALLALVTAGLMANVNRHEDPRLVQRLPALQPLQPATPLAIPNLLKPLTPEQAVKQNQDRPFDAAPDSPAAKFRIQADQDSREHAVECLSQAIYYEAGTESTDGQRAVAQVILNRMRHPGFPSSVCGVVYQGSGLPTGCQFTFTCDGSLARTPVPSSWNVAKKIATEALDGHVFAAIGHATHYHADYVLPYWADSFDKQVQIGHHIFYRLRGSLGTAPAFSQRYAGKEVIPTPSPSNVEVAAEATDQAQTLMKSGLVTPSPLAADAAGPAAQMAPKELLVADNNKGHLLIDQGPVLTTARKRKSNSECSSSNAKQILPTSPDDFRAQVDNAGC